MKIIIRQSQILCILHMKKSKIEYKKGSKLQ